MDQAVLFPRLEIQISDIVRDRGSLGSCPFVGVVIYWMRSRSAIWNRCFWCGHWCEREERLVAYRASESTVQVLYHKEGAAVDDGEVLSSFSSLSLGRIFFRIERMDYYKSYLADQIQGIRKETCRMVGRTASISLPEHTSCLGEIFKCRWVISTIEALCGAP